MVIKNISVSGYIVLYPPPAGCVEEYYVFTLSIPLSCCSSWSLSRD